jgi:RHS repeat-associated protein
MLGSVRMIADAGGNVLDQIAYDSFGNILGETSASNGDRFKFAGMQHDLATDQAGVRAVSTSLGRFISEDWINSGTNRYEYAINSPTNYVDLNGMDPQRTSTVQGQGADPSDPYNPYYRKVIIPPPRRPWYMDPAALGPFTHRLLETVSYVPSVSIIADLADAGVYALEGNNDKAIERLEGVGKNFLLGKLFKLGKVGSTLGAKGKQNIRNYILDNLRRKFPKASNEELGRMLQAAYEEARKAKDSELANTIKQAQKAVGGRQTKYD